MSLRAQLPRFCTKAALSAHADCRRRLWPGIAPWKVSRGERLGNAMILAFENPASNGPLRAKAHESILPNIMRILQVNNDQIHALRNRSKWDLKNNLVILDEIFLWTELWWRFKWVEGRLDIWGPVGGWASHGSRSVCAAPRRLPQVAVTAGLGMAAMRGRRDRRILTRVERLIESALLSHRLLERWKIDFSVNFISYCFERSTHYKTWF